MMKLTFIVMVLGYWGRGKTLKEAAENCKKQGVKLTEKAVAWLIIGDSKACVDSDGYIVRDHGSDIIMLGKFFKLGTLTRLVK